jgi:hypothetical protein
MTLITNNKEAGVGQSEALIALAERVEAAAGPDRTLDADIAVAIDFVSEYSTPGSVRALHVDYGGNNSSEAIGRHWPRLPSYSGTVDGARMLLDPRALWCAGEMEEGPFARLCWPQPNGGFVGGYFKASARTPALALVAAALRARAALSGAPK